MIDRNAALLATQILDTPPEEGYDRITNLARHACGTPIALISLIDVDRQWFKSRQGFEPTQTGLDCSVCLHGLEGDDLLVIPDLTADDRTRANPLVTAADGIRFYAGAPLVLADGTSVGMLCVIDIKPRPGGLSADQCNTLRALATTTAANMDLRAAMARLDSAQGQTDAARAALTMNETRWREIIDNLAEGFIIGELIRGADGAVLDWRYEYVNEAWARLVDVSRQRASGSTIRGLFPGVEDEWVMEFADVVETRRTITFVRAAGPIGRTYEGRCFPIGDDRFAVMFRDVSEERGEQARQQAMIEIGDLSAAAADVAEISSGVSEIVGKLMNLSRAAFGRVSGDVETVDIEPNWTAPGVADIAGRYRFADFGDIAQEIRSGEPLIITDTATDPRVENGRAGLQALQIGALVNMPVRRRGRTQAVLIAHAVSPRNWSDAEMLFLRQVADRMEVGIARLEAEQQRMLLVGETTHRMKNTLALVQALAAQSFRGSADGEKVKVFEERLVALATAHDVLLDSAWKPADLSSLLTSVLSKTVDPDRFTVEGPPLLISARSAQTTSLVVHELATNAHKHGAWSRPDGRLLVSWSVEGGVLHLTWSEHGGPPAHRPERQGFGSKLISRGLTGTGGAQTDYGEGGLVARFSAGLDDLVRE